MPRLGTLLNEMGVPTHKIQIVRKGQKTTQIHYPINNGRDWDYKTASVDTNLILDDGGERWDQYSHNRSHATWAPNGTVKGRLKVSRVYTHYTRAKIYEGDKKWSKVEQFITSDIIFDGGARAGWKSPEQLKEALKKDTAAGQDNTVEIKTVESAAQDVSPAAVTPLSSTAVPQEQAPETPAQENTPMVEKTPGQRVSYVRVSSADQHVDRQRESIGHVDREFMDKISARSRKDRQGLEECLAYLRAGDTLVVASIDRLARSLVDLQQLISQITAKGASVEFLKENLSFSSEKSDPRAQLMLGVLGSFAEFERSIIRERQAEGIALAKKAGKYTGRKKALTAEQVVDAQARVAAGESKTQIAEDLGVARATLYRALAENTAEKQR